MPPSVRAALRDASATTAETRQGHLELAARALYREADLDCADARELVGLL